MFTRFCGWCCTSSLRGWMELDWNMTPYIYWFQYSATGMFMAKEPPCLRYWLEFACRCSSRNLVEQSHSMCKMCYCCLCAKQDLNKSNYIFPQTGMFADPETHPLRGFVPFLAGRVLAFGRVFCFFWTLTASVHTVHMPKPVKRSCSKCYAMDCFGTYFAHAQTCDYVRVQSATQWTASVHTLHMPKPEKKYSWTLQKNLTTHQKSKMASKHCTVWSANVPVCALYIYIYIFFFNWWASQNRRCSRAQAKNQPFLLLKPPKTTKEGYPPTPVPHLKF